MDDRTKNHQRIVDALRQLATDAEMDDSETRSLIDQTLEVIDSHLQAVQKDKAAAEPTTKHTWSPDDIEWASPEEIEAAVRDGDRIVEERLRQLEKEAPSWRRGFETFWCNI